MLEPRLVTTLNAAITGGEQLVAFVRVQHADPELQTELDAIAESFTAAREALTEWFHAQPPPERFVVLNPLATLALHDKLIETIAHLATCIPYAQEEMLYDMRECRRLHDVAVRLAEQSGPGVGDAR